MTAIEWHNEKRAIRDFYIVNNIKLSMSINIMIVSYINTIFSIVRTVYNKLFDRIPFWIIVYSPIFIFGVQKLNGITNNILIKANLYFCYFHYVILSRWLLTYKYYSVFSKVCLQPILLEYTKYANG